jgi:predicted transcriptional regulator of viral defense system
MAPRFRFGAGSNAGEGKTLGICRTGLGGELNATARRDTNRRSKYIRDTVSYHATATLAKTTTLLRLARAGPVRARDLDDAGIPRAYLKRLCDRGLLEQVERGLYRLADAPVTELSTLADVSKRIPHAIICLLSALQVHGMTTEAPHAVWVLIDRRARMPKVTSPMLEVVRASGAARAHGVETRMVDGVKVQLTTPAKTVADCFRFRRHVGLEVARAALRDYLKKRKGSIDALVEAARADRIYAFMRPYLEALA